MEGSVKFKVKNKNNSIKKKRQSIRKGKLQKKIDYKNFMF